MSLDSSVCYVFAMNLFLLTQMNLTYAGETHTNSYDGSEQAYRPDMPYDATGTVAHLQFHVNIGRKNCRMSIVYQALYERSGRGNVTLTDGMIKIKAEDL